MNFDKELMTLFAEVVQFERMRFQIPWECNELASREKFRVMREDVLLVVSDYNAVVCLLDTHERRLFADRIQYLDRKIEPGVKVNWTSSKAIIEFSSARRPSTAPRRLAGDDVQRLHGQNPRRASASRRRTCRRS